MENPNITDTLGELDAGIFMQQLEAALKEVALGVIRCDKKKGSVTMVLELDRIGESDSVTVNHTLKFNKPTRRVKQTEEATTSTPMYVNNLGYLTISPQTQEDMFQANRVLTCTG
jgi:hypothetical protein